MSKKSQQQSRKRKAQDTRRIADKFALKTWYKVLAPDVFGGEQIAETPAANPDFVVNRTVQTTLMDLTGDYKKMHVKLTFKIDKIKGDTATSEFNGHEYTRDYLRSLIRRRRTRIDGIFNLTSKDGAKLRASVIALTPFRCKTSHERAIREIMNDVLIKRGEKTPFDKLILEIVHGKLATEIYKKAKKIHPIQNIDIWKTRVVNLPTIKLPDEPKPILQPDMPEKETIEEEEVKVKEEAEEISKTSL